jgi:gliding motility-associated-like protein
MNVSRICFFLFVYFVNTNFCNAQVFFTAGDSLKLPCTSNCIKVNSKFPKPLTTSAYTVDSIPFNPLVVTGYTTLTLADDSFSNILPIGFPFCFYNNTFSSCVISTNGVLSFDLTYANDFCTFNAVTLPFISTSFPGNSICGPFTDMDFKSNSVLYYATVGTAPNRKFVVSYNNMRLFSSSCNNKECTFQVVLNETTNIVEMHIAKKDTCAAAGLGSVINFATLGLQNSNATASITAPGKNGSIWSLSNTSYRFSPNGAPAYNVQYYFQGIATSYPNVDSPNVCLPPTLDTAKLKIVYTQTCPSQTYTDSIILYKSKPIFDTAIVSGTTCTTQNIGSIILQYINGSTLQFAKMPSGTYSSTNSWTGLTHGIYTIAVKDTAGCVDTAKVTVPLNNPMYITVDSSGKTDCDTSIKSGFFAITVNSGTPPYTYLWSNGSTTKDLIGVGVGIYTLTATDVNGCSKQLVVDVQRAGIGYIDSVVQPACGSLTATGYISLQGVGGTGPFSFLWNTADSTNYVDSCIALTVYTCLITDSKGCTKNYATVLGGTNFPGIINVVTRPTCDKSNGTLEAIAGGGKPPYQYLWTTGDTTKTITNVDSNIYSVIITDSVGCAVTVSKFVDDTLEFDTQLAIVQAKCGLANGSISITMANSIGPYTFSWSNGTTANPLTGLGSGTFICTTTDGNGCIETDTAVLTLPPTPQLTLLTTNLNCDTSLGAVLAQASNFNGTVLYSWSNGGTGSSITGLQAGVYSVVATDVNGCSSASTCTITNVGAPHLQVVDFLPPLCAGDNSGVVTLQGFAGQGLYKYSIDGTNFDASAVISGISSGTYTIYILDQYGCQKDTTITFLPKSAVLLNTPPIDTQICFKDILAQLPLFASGGILPYAFTVDNVFQASNNIAQNLSVGTHTIIVTDSLGCKNTQEIIVPGPSAELAVTFLKTDVPCYQENAGGLSAQASGGWQGYSYLWNNNATLDSIGNLKAGIYSVTVTDAKGCSIQQAQEVFQLRCCKYNLPNAFTPDNNDVNDKIKAIGLGNLTAYKLRIYNRWGTLLFETETPADFWNGNYKGKQMEMDTYFYIMQYECDSDKQPQTSKGEFILIR